MKNIMKNRTGLLLFLLFLLLPLAAQANTVTEGGKDGLTWNFHSEISNTADGVRYDIYYENDFIQGMLTNDAEMDVEPYGQLDEDGMPWVIWSRQTSDGYFHLFLSYFTGAHWSEPVQLPIFTERTDDRECFFRLGENGNIYMTFVHNTITGQKVMFGVYKTWSGGWSELDSVYSPEPNHQVKQPNIHLIHDQVGLAQVLLGFIHIYPEGEGASPPDGHGWYETIDQYLRVFNSGDTSPWFQVQ